MSSESISQSIAEIIAELKARGDMKKGARSRIYGLAPQHTCPRPIKSMYFSLFPSNFYTINFIWSMVSRTDVLARDKLGNISPQVFSADMVIHVHNCTFDH